MINQKTLFTCALLLSSAIGATANAKPLLVDINPQLDPINIPPVLIPVPLPEDKQSEYEVRTAGAHFFKRVVSSTKFQTTSSRKFTDLKYAKTRVMIPPNSSALINASFDAESRCNEPGGTADGWCEVRILINGTEGAPAASKYPSDTLAFDSSDGGNEGEGSWESHAMSRHQCVTNKSDDFKPVEIAVEWKLTNFPADTNPQFWLDDWSLVVEMAEDCKVRKIVK